MLLSLIAAFTLQTASAQAAPAATNQTPAATPPARGQRHRPGDGLVCQNRAPTGSVMRRNICRSERRAEADSRIAQQYAAELTRGTAHEPMPLGGSGPATP